MELDWICVCWDGDFYLKNNQWIYRKFKGTKWQKINKEITRNYLLNAYRVLLTRARQGMIIFIPYGPWANAILKPETEGTGMPLLKGSKARVEPTNEPISSLRELLAKIYKR